jgi:hypothetical protein
MNTEKTSLENESQPSCLGAVISSFNTKSKRMVKVISGDDVFEGEVTAISWDIDQWAFMVDGEWFCQSEINCL